MPRACLPRGFARLPRSRRFTVVRLTCAMVLATRSARLLRVCGNRSGGTIGEPGWKEHVILPPSPDLATTDFRISQMRSLALAESAAPTVLFWLELHREGAENISFIPHLIDEDSGVGTQIAAADLNRNGRPESVVGNKKGNFAYRKEPGAK